VNKLLLLFASLVLAYVGFQMGEGTWEKEKKRELLDVHPEREYSLTENKSFTFVVYALNQALWCERSLESIFAQEYEFYRVIFVDDASTDSTYETAQNFVMSAAQDSRVILMRNETRLGFCASLYRAVEHCSDKEIVIPLEAKDWLSQELVLSRLNAAFQNSDVWIAESQAMMYPQFQIKETEGVFAFYAALFKEVPLKNLFFEGRPAHTKGVCFSSLQELAGGRVRKFTDPFLFANDASFSPSQKQTSVTFFRKPSQALLQFPKSLSLSEKPDMLIFSYDRPLQLYALLESIRYYMSGLSQLSVIYRASDERYTKAYEELYPQFPSICWIRQSDQPHKDFKPLVLQALKKFTSPYILFGVDDIVVKDFVDLTCCIDAMEKTGAYGFYLRLGSHVNHCYMVDQPQSIPPHLPFGEHLIAWDFASAQHDWAFPHTLDMTIYRRADVEPVFQHLNYKHPNRLEQSWAEKRPVRAMGLCFEQSKIVNLPLNMVNPSDCRHSHFMTAEELLVKWNEGMKMNIDPLFRIENSSPHIDYTPEFIKR
jgi:hypothetical protein